MSTNLSGQQLSQLESAMNAGDRIGYYSLLARFGDPYGGLALSVVNNDPGSGAIANFYLYNEARNHFVSLTNDQLASLGIALMQADYAARKDSGGAELNYRTIQQYHAAVLTVFGIPANAWTPNFALDYLQTEQEKAALWDTLLTSSFSAFAVINEFLGKFDDINVQNYLIDLGLASAKGLTSQSNVFGGYTLTLSSGVTVIGGRGSGDNLLGTTANDVIMGFDGDDTITGMKGSDRIYGGAGNDILVGGSSSGSLAPSDLNLNTPHAEWNDGVGDTLNGGMGNDTYLIYTKGGQEAWDWAWMSVMTASDLQTLLTKIDTIDESDGDGIGQIIIQEEPFFGPLKVSRSEGALLHLYTNDSGVQFFGSNQSAPGNVALYSSGGITYAFIMTYNSPSSPVVAIKDFYQGDFGIILEGYNHIRPGQQGDNRPFYGTPDIQTITGSIDHPKVDYQGSTAGVHVNLAAGTGHGGYAEGDTYTHILHVTGSSYGDTLTGNADGNSLNGGAGNDTLRGATEMTRSTAVRATTCWTARAERPTASIIPGFIQITHSLAMPTVP